MIRAKQLLFYRLNKPFLQKKGQVVFLLVSIVLIFFVFLVIILGNLSSSSLQFGYIFRRFISLRSLSISGLRYALYQINQDPNFTTSSALVNMPQGNFNYSVINVSPNIKKIIVQANLSGGSLSQKIVATATIDSSGKILDIEANEE